MLILHIGWLLTTPTDKTRGLVVWAETDRKADMTMRALARLHPFTASTRALRRALIEWMPSAEFLLKERASEYTSNIWLPTTDNTPRSSLPLLHTEPPAPVSTPDLAVWQVETLRIDPEQALAFLAALPPDTDETPGIHVGADVSYWRAAGRFALELIARQRFMPALVERDDKFLALWQPLLDESGDAARVTRLVNALPPLCRAYVLRDTHAPPMHPPRALVENFLATVVDAFARSHHPLPASDSHRTTIAEEWLAALSGDPQLDASASDLRAFYEQYRAWAEAVPGAIGGDSFRLCFRLEPPTPPDEIPADDVYAPRANARAWSLRFLLQATDDPSLLVPVEQVWSARGGSAKFLNRTFDAPHERVLAGLGHASRLFAPLEASLRTARPAYCSLTSEEAYTFLHETALLLRSFGFGVLAPGLHSKFGVRVHLKSASQETPKGGVAGISFDDIVNYDWQLVLGDTVLSREEFDKLAALKTPLVQIRGKWVELHPDQLQSALKFWEKRQERAPQHSDSAGEMNAQEALRLALGLDTTKADTGLPLVEVVADGWIGELLTSLQNNQQMQSLTAPPEFQGTLRPYQNTGLAWLAFLRQWGLGGCLADDMGLGKCISAESLLEVNGVLRTAEDIWSRYAGMPEFDGEGYWADATELLNVSSIDETSGCIVNAPVRRLYRQHVQEKLHKITLSDGSAIAITRAHCLLTPQGWTNELKVGDYVCVPAKLTTAEQSQDLDLIKFLAWQIAEGYENSGGRLRITQNSVDRLQELKQVIQILGQRYGFKINEPSIQLWQTKTPALRINSRAYQRFLSAAHYDWGKRSRDKRIPPLIMQSNREGVRVFLRNYFDAEANANVAMQSIEISTASPFLIQQLAALLRRFGIWMRISVKQKRATNGLGIYRPYCFGVIGGNSARRFHLEIGFSDAKKKSLLEVICAKTDNTNVEGIPASHLVAQAVRTTGLPLRHFGMHNPIYLDGSQQFSRASLARVCDAMDRVLNGETEQEYRRQKISKWTKKTLDAYARLDRAELRVIRQRLQWLMDQEVYYCKIKSIEDVPYDGWVYDFEVSGHHNFVANNILCHNTVQVAAFLLHERAHANGNAARPTLVVCPTSVVSNWERELARFAPDLSVYAHHGAARKKNDLTTRAAVADVVLSSYPLLQRDEKQLTALGWNNVILDEAQNIKNPATKQAQSARKLPAQWRLALTGTPVENRLGELWSIFQFLNPGYLGSQADFQHRFANPIERGGSDQAAQQLKRLTAPFILRRVKTDPQVISDLPAKNEMKIYCNLTREQATLYEAVVRDSMMRLEQAEGMARRGIVLATLTKLKQVCNHPAQFLGDASALPGRSGKLARLTEMLGEVRAVRERALVFTQFAEMGKLLQEYLRSQLADEVLFLYGSTPTKTRTQMIDRFQNDPHGPSVFILSIKAGGTGLNLTRANHVFHFDRWWNPAVENQATDRAFRIGQTRNVQVYKYLCAGTFEEQIDAMIERKQQLAATIVGTSESWLTELSTAQLRDLFQLRSDAIGD